MRKNNWFMFIVNGLIAILFGLLMLFGWNNILNLILYFGLLVLAGGVILMIVAVSNMKKEKPHALLLTEAIAAILIGAIIAFWPDKSLKIFLVLIGLWATIMGLLQIILAIQMKNKVSNHNFFTINGVITLVFGLLLFFINPVTVVKLLVSVIGLIALAAGLFLVYLGFKVKGAKESA
jgi:uncharacterized membrane protein HdeD (DUF308 family)